MGRITQLRHSCTHLYTQHLGMIKLLIVMIQFWLDSVDNRHLPKANKFLDLGKSFLTFYLNSICCHPLLIITDPFVWLSHLAEPHTNTQGQTLRSAETKQPQLSFWHIRVPGKTEKEVRCLRQIFPINSSFNPLKLNRAPLHWVLEWMVSLKTLKRKLSNWSAVTLWPTA